MGFLKNFKKVFSKNEKDDFDNGIPEKNEKPLVGKETFRYLDELIHGGQNEIALDTDIVLADREESKYSHGIVIDVDDLVLDGLNHSIDARDFTRIFDISANITLKNIIFKNGDALNGGAININESCSVSCINCSFEANSSSYGGGAVSIGENSFLSCDGCSFDANSSKFRGGAISNDKGNMNFEKCSFKNNDSGNDTPEDIEKLNKSNIGETKVFRSSYSGEGGAVHNSGGGAIFSDCVFENNVAGSGGAISHHYNDELTISNCLFKSNNANRTDGGAFFNLGKLKIKDSVFERNAAEYHGGVIFNSQTFEMSNCEFISNTAKKSNGGVLSNNFDEYGPSENDNCLIRDCSFTNNMAIGAGAVLDNYKGVLTIEDCVFEKNTANSAGVMINGDRIDLTGCVLKGNTASGYFSEGLGGAIGNIGDLNMGNCTLSNNYAEHACGAIYDEGSMKITDCIFEANNVGKGEKCAIGIWEGSLILESSDFSGEISEVVLNKGGLEIKKCEFGDERFIVNESRVDILDEEHDLLKNVIRGGNIHVIDLNKNAITFNDLKELIGDAENELTLESDVILGNGEESIFENGIELDVDNLVIDGDGHYINANAKSSIFTIAKGSVALKNIRFKQAYSERNGAAINVENASLTLEKCHFENNISKWHGGAIYNSNTILSIDGCTFDANNSLDDGGAIYLASGHVCLKNNCIFTNNISKEDGGAIYNLNSSLAVENSSFENNESAEDGGAIYNVNGSLTLNDCEFKGNTAKDGGSIANEGENRIDLKNCHFNDDGASKIGGSILNFGKGISLEKCDFKNCSAELGGCIAMLKGFASVKNSCSFTGSVSQSKGGAIYNESLGFNIDDAIFTANGSENLGGAIYNEGSLILDKCRFCNNSSEIEGGAIWNSYNLEVYKSEFDANSSNERGSSIYHGGSEESNLKVVASEFAHNRLSDGGAIYVLEGFALAESIEFKSFEDDASIAIHNESGILKVDRPKFDNLKRAIYNDHIIYLNKKDKIEEQVISGDNAQPIRFKGDDVLPDGWIGFDYLSNLIRDGDGYVKLDCAIQMHESEQKFYEGGIELDRDGLVIDGGGNVIDANNFSRIFYITGRNITLKNIIFKNGKYFKNYLDSKYGGGGAIYALHESCINIIDCEFLDNVSRHSAGCIVNKGEKMQIERSKFENNDAQLYGGAVLNGGLLNMNGCSLDSNTAKVDGGGLYNHDGVVTARDCRFSRCGANSGGAIDNIMGSLILDECEFADCTAEWDGGAIHNYEGSVELNSGNFHKNNANGTGKKFVSSSLLEDDAFQANTSIDDIKGYGGAITNYNASLKLKSICFEDNASKSMAQSIYAYGGSVDVEDSRFRGGDRNVILNDGLITFKNCDFDDIHEITNRSRIRRHYETTGLNIKNERGRIHTIFEDKIEDYKFFTALDGLIHSGVKNIVLDSNYILSDNELDRYGNGILIDVNDVVIDGNGFVIDGNGKSNIFLIRGKNVTLKNITFINSFSNLYAAITNGGSLNVESCLFMNNSTGGEYGGAVYNVGVLDLSECRFKNNGAIKRAGAVYNGKGTLNVDKCCFEDNISAEKGNAIFNCDGFLTLGESRFIKNGLETSESAIYNTGNFVGSGFGE